MSRALIADDDLDILDVVRTVLVRAGHEVEAVTNGTDAVEKLRTMEFDFVVLDVQMPGLSGLGVLEATADMESRPPVMLLSGFSAFQDRRNGLEAGASMYVAKPFRVRDFLVAVQDLLDGRPGAESVLVGSPASNRR